MASPRQCASSDSDDFTSAELQVAQVLLELPLLVQKSEFSLGLIPAWSLRRKRSALDSPPDSAVPAPPPPSKKLKESSPTSPLVINSLPLSRSESDENTNAKRSKNKPSLNKISQHLEAIDELTKQNQVLKGDVEAMKQRYNHLKTINSELKAQKQEMILGCKNESAIPEIGTSSSAMKVVKFTVKSPSSTPEIHHHHHHRHHQIQPSMNNQAAAMAEQQSNKSQNFQVPMGAIPLYDPSSLSPMGIPDLNVSLEEISQRNYSRIMAARARQNRIQICKTKNNGAARVQSPNPCM